MRIRKKLAYKGELGTSLLNRTLAQGFTHLREKVEPGVIKDRRRNSRAGVCDLFDLVGKPQHHFCEQLGIGFKHISSMTLRRTSSLEPGLASLP